MDIKQAADRLGVSTATIRNWIRTGKLKATLETQNARVKYVIDDDELLKLRGEEWQDTSSSMPSAVPEQGISLPREWVIEAIKQAVKESYLDFSDSLNRHIHEQNSLYGAIQRELEALQSEIAATKEEVATTKSIVQLQREQQQRNRDEQVLNQLQTFKEAKHRKKKSLWW